MKSYTFRNREGKSVQLSGDLTLEDLIRRGYTDFRFVPPETPLKANEWRADAECSHSKGHEFNGAGMWICLTCRADITPVTPVKPAPVCTYCDEPITRGQCAVPDEWDEPGDQMHLGCSAEDQDGQDLDR